MLVVMPNQLVAAKPQLADAKLLLVIRAAASQFAACCRSCSANTAAVAIPLAVAKLNQLAVAKHRLAVAQLNQLVVAKRQLADATNLSLAQANLH